MIADDSLDLKLSKRASVFRGKRKYVILTFQIVYDLKKINK